MFAGTNMIGSTTSALKYYIIQSLFRVTVEAMSVELDSWRGIGLFQLCIAFGAIFCFLVFQNGSYFFMDMSVRAAVVVLWHVPIIA